MQRRSQILETNGWSGLFGSSKRQNNHYISIKNVANLDLEASLLLGGVSSIAFFEFIKKTYSVITSTVESFFDAIFTQDDNIRIETKDKSLILNAIQNSTLIVRDKIGGLVMNSKGLFYLDSYTMLVYKYNSNTEVESTSIQYKLAPYVHKLFDKFDFEGRANSNRANVNCMMNDILLHMILNDMYKILKLHNNHTTLSMNDKSRITDLLNLINNRKVPNATSIHSHNNSYHVLSEWLRSSPQHTSDMFNKFRDYSKTDRLFLVENVETQSTVDAQTQTKLSWDTEFMLTNSISVEILTTQANESANIKHWMQLFQIRYQFKFQSR